ncbi:MAG: hemerythrin domain-containing protein [Smithellaceae bacterium]|nr:hemerythrin domain-containing protein [Smithellaceae bacterium]
MKATQQLKNEHDGVRLMLRILGEVSRQLDFEGHVPNEHFEDILEFLKVFVDKCHHGKEEELLFPALTKVGIPQDGPIAVMLFEHEMGRKYIRVMTDAFERHKLKDASAAPAIAQNAQDYIALLTDHIDKENNILFAMADDRLSEKAQEELFDGFEKIEESRIGVGKHEEFHALLHKLGDLYLKNGP